MRKLLGRAERLAGEHPVYAYRLAKRVAGRDLLMELAPARGRLAAAGKAVAGAEGQDDAAKAAARPRAR